MVDDPSKRAPTGIGQDAEAFAARLQRAAVDDQTRPPQRVRLTVGGGLPSQGRRDLSVEIDSAGTVASTANGEALPSPAAGRKSAADPAALLALLPAIDAAALVAAAQHVPIPPDSLVGRLELVDGDASRTIVFMADPEQAKTAGFRLPEPIERLVEAVYSTGALAAGVESIRP